jgi:hypothetical protein
LLSASERSAIDAISSPVEKASACKPRAKFFGALRRPNLFGPSLEDMLPRHRSIETEIAWVSSSALLRADEEGFATDSIANRCWRENCAGNYNAKCGTDQSKNPTVSLTLASGFLHASIDSRFIEQ